MNNKQWNCFADYLHGTFIRFGFEVVDEPHIDYVLQGFRATYIRRYLLQQPTLCDNGILNTLISVAGLPFGHLSQKMIILASPRDLDNVPIADTLKLRIHIDEKETPTVIHGDHLQPTQSTSSRNNIQKDNSNIQLINQQHESNSDKLMRDLQFFKDLSSFVSHLLEVISPGLIDLPTEMKLEILKKLNIDSIIRMSQVNSEFRELIFRRGESLWRHLCYRDFKLKKINRMLHRSWLELYKETYIMEQIEICRKERALPGLPERPALPPPPGAALLQIEWLPEVLELPFYPLHDNHPMDNNNHLLPFAALEYYPRRRANSLDGMDM